MLLQALESCLVKITRMQQKKLAICSRFLGSTFSEHPAKEKTLPITIVLSALQIPTFHGIQQQFQAASTKKPVALGLTTQCMILCLRRMEKLAEYGGGQTA